MHAILVACLLVVETIPRYSCLRNTAYIIIRSFPITNIGIVMVTSNNISLIDHLMRREKNKAEPAGAELSSVYKCVRVLFQTYLSNKTRLEHPRSVTGISV